MREWKGLDALDSPTPTPLFPSSPVSPSMDTSGYDVKAWQAYYESQGYDAATASSYAYYALQQAQAASTSTAAASSSSAAYGVRSSPIRSA